MKETHVDLQEYDIVGFASGIDLGKFYLEIENFARENLPFQKEVFFLYTCAMDREGFTDSIKEIALEKDAVVLGAYGCRGYNTYGPWKVIGGMNKKDFAKLCMNFDKEPNVELYEYWNEMLEDYDPYYVEKAIESIIKTDKFFPTYSRILEVLKELPLEEIPTEEKKRRMKALGIEPEWLDKEYEDELDEETEKEFAEFQSFIKEFRK